MSDQTMLRIMIDSRDKALQKSRIAFSNRLDAIARGSDGTNGNGMVKQLEEWKARFEQLERYIDEDIKRLAQDIPIVVEMCKVKGVGFILAAKVAAMVDISKADTASALWRYAGYGVVDGQSERLRKGEKAHYNQRLKSACYLVGTSFLKSNSPYRRVYDTAREYYTNTRPEWTKLHCHRAAMRKMIKRWLCHLWMVWRVMEGLEIRTPYVAEKLGHTHIDWPEDYGWEFEGVVEAMMEAEVA